MYSDNNKILFSEYCTFEEIHYCKQKLKAKLFSTFCKLAKEGERYTLTYWYSLVPLTNKNTSYQLSISAIIKDKHRDTEDMLRKIIPNMQKSVFSLFSGLFKINKNHNNYIGEEYMVIKCPKCHGSVPYSLGTDITTLKMELQAKEAELKEKDLIIAQMKKDNEQMLATIAELKNTPQSNIENYTHQDSHPTNTEENEVAPTIPEQENNVAVENEIAATETQNP